MIALEEVQALLEARGLEGRLRPRASLRLRPAAEDAGGSWLGGTPRVPAGFEWPEYETGPMAFLAQIALPEVHAALPDADVPADGWLLFFYDQEASAWEQEGAGRVAHVAGDTELDRRAPPDDAVAPAFPVRAVSLTPEWTLPDPFSEEVAELDLDPADYGALVDELARRQGAAPEGDEPMHRLLGHPALVQDPPELAAGRPLLLQLDSDLEGGMIWGDLGRLYFFAHGPEDALAVLQST